MKVRATGRMLNSPEAAVNYLTFSAEDADERAMLAQLYRAWREGSLATLLIEQCDIDKGEAEGLPGWTE